MARAPGICSRDHMVGVSQAPKPKPNPPLPIGMGTHSTSGETISDFRWGPFWLDCGKLFFFLAAFIVSIRRLPQENHPATCGPSA